MDFIEALGFKNPICKLTIKPAELTVKLINTEKFYGDPDPDKSTWISYEGTLNGDEVNIFDYVTLTREPGEYGRNLARSR